MRELGVRVLPNTAGCHSVKEAVTTAQMAREVFGTPWIKLEVIGHADTLQPDVFGLVEAARILTADGFQVFPYTTEDLVVAERLLEAGCEVLMPWGAPIGSGRGLNNEYGLRSAARPLPRRAAGRRRRARPAQPRRARDGDRHGRGAAEHRRRQGRRPGGDGEGLRAGASRREGWRTPPTRWSRATWPRPRPPSSARRGWNDRRRPPDPFYPIVDSADWLRRLLPLGVRFVQLRIKALSGEALRAEIRAEIRAGRDLCRAQGAAMVVNDHWQIAIEEGCDWVHLGQEDLAEADLAAIRRAGLRLGVSTHDHAELDRALSVDPDYVALGPVWPTILKKMKWAPQGLDRVAEWKRLVGATPLCAIGGLTPERGRACLDAGADIVSVVTDITLNADPEARTSEWLAATRAPAAG